jgi:DNA-binding NarL/FixJ family response regulator
MSIRVLLVDDHPHILDALGVFLGSRHELQLLGQASDGMTAVQMADRDHPDVVVMDVRLPGLDGVAAAQQILSQHPSTRIVMLSAQVDGALERRVHATGASALLSKEEVFEKLPAAIARAAASASA